MQSLWTKTKILLLFILPFLVFGCALQKKAKEGSFEKGLTHFQKGSLREARAQLEGVMTQHPDFLKSLVELQKINYSQGKWSFSKNYNELRKSIELFSFNESVPEKNKEIPIKNRGKFDRDLSWKLSKKQLLSLSHPRSLRVKVKSQCL